MEVVKLDIGPQRAYDLLRMDERDIQQLEYDPEKQEKEAEGPMQKLARLRAELDELKQYVSVKEVRVRYQWQTVEKRLDKGLHQEIEILEKSMNGIQVSDSYRRATFNKFADEVEKLSGNLQAQCELAKALNKEAEIALVKGKEKEVKMSVQEEGAKKVEPRSKEEFLSIERGLEELVAKMEEEVGVEDYSVSKRFIDQENIEQVGPNIVTFAEQLRDMSIRISFDKLEEMDEIIEAVISELKLAEAQLDKQNPLLGDIKALKEAAKLTEMAHVFEPQVYGLIERCQTLQIIHQESASLGSETDGINQKIDGIAKDIEEIETSKEKDLIQSEMKGLKDFTLGTLSELDSIINALQK